MQLTDSHAHLSGDVQELLARAHKAYVAYIVDICTDTATLEQGLRLRSSHLAISAAIHPHDAAQMDEEYFAQITVAAKEGKLAAIGETGLDLRYTHSPLEIQIALFKRHQELAKECQLPLIIHCREAFEHFFAHMERLPFVLHCFTGNQSQADEVLARGGFISFSGIVTFKKSTELQAVAKTVPLERMLIETDSPYLAPQSKRGKPNEPAYLPEIASFLADLKGVAVEEVAAATTANAQKLFFLSKVSS